MENATCCVNSRFCWKKSDFPGWEKTIEFGKLFCRMSYHGWTSPMLVGHDERYLEVWQHNNKRELFFSNVGVWYQDRQFFVVAGHKRLNACKYLDGAVKYLLRFFDDPLPFVPDAAYRREGNLENILNALESVIAILRYRVNSLGERPRTQCFKAIDELKGKTA